MPASETSGMLAPKTGSASRRAIGMRDSWPVSEFRTRVASPGGTPPKRAMMTSPIPRSTSVSPGVTEISSHINAPRTGTALTPPRWSKNAMAAIASNATHCPRRANTRRFSNCRRQTAWRGCANTSSITRNCRKLSGPDDSAGFCSAAADSKCRMSGWSGSIFRMTS